MSATVFQRSSPSPDERHNAMTNMRRLLDLKQSVWLDYLSRGMTRSGELHAMIADGLRGMTSNPTIFEHAIGHTSDYDQDLIALDVSEHVP